MAYNGHGASYSSGASSSSSSSASSSTAGSGSKRVRTVTLVRRPGSRLGFSLRGGKEHGTGFFVTAVDPNTEASQQGLLVGDQILRVNGFPVEDATHKEVLQLILGQNTVALKVKSVGMIPVKECAEDELSWQIVDSKINSTSNTDNHQHLNQIDVYKPDPNDDPPGRHILNDVKMILKVPPRAKLGCGICKGPEWKPGVFVQFTKENSIARIAGLRPGDQILQCNNFPFSPETPFNEAVSVMRCSGILELVVRKGAGLDLFPGESSGYNSSASSVAGDNPPRLTSLNEDNITHHQHSDNLQFNGNHTSHQSERINSDHSNSDQSTRSKAYPGGSTVIHVGGDEPDNHKIAEIRMVSQQLETKTTTVFVEVHHSEEDNVSHTQSEASTDRLTNSSSVSSFTSSASSLSSAISQELERRSKRTSLDTTNKTCNQTDKLIKSGLAKEKVQQHEQLMLEFKKAHKKMFSTDGDVSCSNNTTSKEEREETRLQNEKSLNGCNNLPEQFNKMDIINKNNDQDRMKIKRQNAPPPPPPPLPTGMVAKEEKLAQKVTTPTTSQPLSTKKQPAPPPPPPPSPPYCPTPDYDTASLASHNNNDHNIKNGGESDTVKRRVANNALKGGKVQDKSDIVEMQSLESFKLTNPSKVKPKPPNTYFTPNCNSSIGNQSDTSNGTASTIPMKDCQSKPIVTIREYPANRDRKNPTKFDFLQNVTPSQSTVDDKQPITSRLQNELCQTLQRATTLTKNETEVANKFQNGQPIKNGGTVVTINISSQNSVKNDTGKQPFYLFPNGKTNGVDNKKLNDLMQQSSTNNNNNNNNNSNNKNYISNGKGRSSIDNTTKNSVTFNFSNKAQETRSVNIVQPNGILKNGNNISHVQIQSQIPQQKSIKFGGM